MQRGRRPRSFGPTLLAATAPAAAPPPSEAKPHPVDTLDGPGFGVEAAVVRTSGGAVLLAALHHAHYG